MAKTEKTEIVRFLGPKKSSYEQCQKTEKTEFEQFDQETLVGNTKVNKIKYFQEKTEIFLKD